MLQWKMGLGGLSRSLLAKYWYKFLGFFDDTINLITILAELQSANIHFYI